MIKLLKILMVVLLLAAALAWFFRDHLLGMSVEILIPRAVVVQQVEQRFPTVRSQGIMTVRLSEPVLDFHGSRNRLGVNAKAEIRLLGLIPIRGSIECEGLPAFRAENGTIIFTDVKVRKFQADGIPASRADEVSGLVVGAALAALGGLEIHRIDPAEAHGRLASMTLRGIRVSDRGLLVKLALRE